MEINWIEITENTYRMKVPGGSIVRYQEKTYGANDDSIAIAMVFVPEIKENVG